jgi:2-(1,2-epoxy-1,2-dihydrophenyl)acetyl-CoA isomerase
MGIIETENDSFACRQEDDFALLTFKEQTMKVLVTVNLKDELISVLSSIENTPQIKGLLVLYTDEYSGDTEYEDLMGYLQSGKMHEGRVRYLQTYQASIHHYIIILLNFPVPIVSGMSGDIGSESFGFSLTYDFRLATEKTIFKLSNLKNGLPPSGLLSYFLVRNIGQAKALDLLLSKPTIDASEALDLGLVSRIVPEAELESRCLEQLKEMSKYPSYAISETRRLVQPDFSDVQKHIDASMEGALRNLYLMRQPQ